MHIPSNWFRPGRGPRYLQLHRLIRTAIDCGDLAPGDPLPPERDLARAADVSRVTVRKAIGQLAADGLIEQRHGAGSFVRPPAPKLEQSLSSLVSFTETMQARGMTPTSETLSHGLHRPTSAEMLSLGLSAGDQVARLTRLRRADGTPMALEQSTLPADILPQPDRVDLSLYTVLRTSGQAPTRAIQRVTATNLTAPDALVFNLPQGTAVLKIERTGYLPTGRPIEFTSGLYRPDLYDFVSELRLD
ncbi:GntR family transcriptional regulator [Aliiroseovarius sediminis]|uniref:GntR family transcriptional regulator n=1 Tax=Aliiroseovarius sediminis TaxID=2925839 RepID=UPI001F55CCE6|nr:GntR family transcriptional regulator [Aliiroseovarius sediminis]MCI2393521.1 GntR family transcriptional regulator [Aliiroseovarius sediminis]